METYTVIVTGPPGSGKTAFLKSLPEANFFKTPEPVVAEKSGQNVYIEFARVNIDGCFFYLVSVPADEHFRFVWERLADGLLGFIVLINGSDMGQVEQGKELVKALQALPDIPFMVAVNRLKRATDTPAVLKKALGVTREERITNYGNVERAETGRVINGLLSLGLKQLRKLA